jgi:hypothetical protein
MIEVVAAACLLASPEHCRDVTLTFEAQAITPMSCMMNGQTELAKWTNEHPGWRIARFTCRPAGQVAKL